MKTTEEEMLAALMLDALPNDGALKKLSAMALESATEALAKHAEQFALTLPYEVTGRQALKAFADAIRSTNLKAFGSGEGRS